MMYPIIKPAGALQDHYNAIAELCRTHKTPVFLTKNGEGDTVIMDIETYAQREEDLGTAARLLTAEALRVSGHKGYSIEEFEQDMLTAINQGVKQKP